MNAKSLFIVFLWFASMGTGCAAAPNTDAYLLHYFLDIKEDRFYSTGQDGERFYDELQAYKHRERTYFDLLGRSRKEGAVSDDVRRFIFLGHAAKSRNDAGLMEAFNSDFMSVFGANSETVLATLKQIPALQPSSCYYLGRYFGFEDRNIGGLELFLEKYRKPLDDALGTDRGRGCVDTMKDVAK